jgi:RNA polymerase sigma factor (sigma-70 family)
VDDEGFEAFYEREHGRLRRSLLALTRDLEVATDATDEALARAVASWPAVRDMDYPAAWLHRVGINLVNRHHRRRRHEENALRRAEAPAPTFADDHAEVWDAVAALPTRQRTAIVLRYLADLPEPAIAEVMRISRGTVASTLSDARQRLGTLLADDDNIQEAPHV